MRTSWNILYPTLNKIYLILTYLTINQEVWLTIKHQHSALVALCERNPPATGEFPTQRANNVESVSMPWCHHIFTQECGDSPNIALSQGQYFFLRVSPHALCVCHGGHTTSNPVGDSQRTTREDLLKKIFSLWLVHTVAPATNSKDPVLKCNAGLILGLRPANERRCYKVTPSLIGRAQT